jgi:hypothetical protein
MEYNVCGVANVAVKWRAACGMVPPSTLVRVRVRSYKRRDIAHVVEGLGFRGLS